VHCHAEAGSDVNSFWAALLLLLLLVYLAAELRRLLHRSDVRN
jgi:hypothetical protein